MKEYHFKEVDSTSLYLKKNYHNLDDLTIVSTDFQTDGHGRYNRKWISNRGENLLFSILIKDKRIIEKYKSLSLASAVCIYELLHELNIKNISIKWPNDVYVNDKKIAGILLESISNGSEIISLVIGVGLNINTSKFDNLSATSVALEMNTNVDINKIKKKIYKKFISMVRKINDDTLYYLNIIRNNNYLKGKKVFLKENNKNILIKVLDINDDNSLLVENENGDVINIYSGEIIVK